MEAQLRWIRISLSLLILTVGLLFVPAVFGQSGSEIAGDIPLELVPLAKQYGCSTRASCIAAYRSNPNVGIQYALDNDLYALEKTAIAHSYKDEVLLRVNSASDPKAELVRIAQEILSDREDLRERFDLEREEVERADIFYTEARASGVDVETCKFADPVRDSLETIERCFEFFKSERVQQYIPESINLLGAVREADSFLSLKRALARGDFPECGTTLDECGEICLQPGSPSFCDEIALGFLGDEGTRNLNEARAQYSDATEFYNKNRTQKILFETLDGRKLTNQSEIGSYLVSEADKGNVEAVERGLEFLVNNKFISPDKAAFARGFVEETSRTGRQLTLSACRDNPNTCDEFIPETLRDRYTEGRQVITYMTQELLKQGVPSPEACEFDLRYTSKCVAAGKAFLQLKEVQDRARTSVEAKRIVEEIRQHVLAGEQGVRANEQVKNELLSKGSISYGGQVFTDESKFRDYFDASCKKNPEGCIFSAAKFLGEDTVDVFERYYDYQVNTNTTPLSRSQLPNRSFTPQQKEEILEKVRQYVNNPTGLPPPTISITYPGGISPPSTPYSPKPYYPGSDNLLPREMESCLNASGAFTPFEILKMRRGEEPVGNKFEIARQCYEETVIGKPVQCPDVVVLCSEGEVPVHNLESPDACPVTKCVSIKEYKGCQTYWKGFYFDGQGCSFGSATGCSNPFPYDSLEQCQLGNGIDKNICPSYYPRICEPGEVPQPPLPGVRCSVPSCIQSGSYCGDNTCNADENIKSCPKDCDADVTPPFCGDAKCSADETKASCSVDCGNVSSVCGNALCELGETVSCAQDCSDGPYCGDNECNIGETANSCPGDCQNEHPEGLVPQVVSNVLPGAYYVQGDDSSWIFLNNSGDFAIYVVSTGVIGGTGSCWATDPTPYWCDVTSPPPITCNFDGICNANESNATCSSDCGSPNQGGCSAWYSYSSCSGAGCSWDGYANVCINSNTGLENTRVYCADGLDNDGDSLVDSADPNCDDFTIICNYNNFCDSDESSGTCPSDCAGGGPTDSCPAGFHSHGDGGDGSDGYCINDADDYSGTCYNIGGSTVIPCPTSGGGGSYCDAYNSDQATCESYDNCHWFSDSTGDYCYYDTSNCGAYTNQTSCVADSICGWDVATSFCYSNEGGGGYCDNDGACEYGETNEGCASDCQIGADNACGNNSCEPGEDVGNCSVDCGSDASYCGDNVCNASEDSINCSSDCGVDCRSYNDSGACDSDAACFWAINGGVCYASAEVDSCNNDYNCDSWEHASCGDCATPAVCGNNVCDQGETADTCAYDCGGGGGGYCGDYSCNNGETSSTCPVDCGGSSTCNTYTTIDACHSGTGCGWDVAASYCYNAGGGGGSCPEGFHYHSESGGYCMNDGENYDGTCYNSDGSQTITCPTSGGNDSACDSYSPESCETYTNCFLYVDGSGTSYCYYDSSGCAAYSNESSCTTASCAWDLSYSTCYSGGGGGGGYCGDYICNNGENNSTCPSDCGGGGGGGETCGNGYCGSGETESNCPSDCSGGYCGNGYCESNENASNCGTDCGGSAVCGDNFCAGSESYATCPADCQEGNNETCGNGFCGSGEDSNNCPADCGSPAFAPNTSFFARILNAFGWLFGFQN
jgi:hypothetical protein